MKWSLTRLLDAPADKAVPLLDRGRADKAVVCAQALTPLPVAEVELKAGGRSYMMMKNPEGQKIPCPGTYLEVVPGRKLVFTDAFIGDWNPREGAPFMVAIVTFEPEGNKTRYTATVRHWTEERPRAQHEQMGFHKGGWGQCADQLEALAKTI